MIGFQNIIVENVAVGVENVEAAVAIQVYQLNARAAVGRMRRLVDGFFAEPGHRRLSMPEPAPAGG